MIESFEARDPVQLLLEQLLGPVSLLMVAILIGIFIEQFPLWWLNRIAKRTAWGIDDLLITIFRGGMTIIWSILIGVYLAVQRLDFLSSAHVRAINNFLLAVLILSLAVAVSRVFIGAIYIYSHTNDFSRLTIVNNIIRILAYIAGVIVIFTVFGIPITPALAAVGFGSLGVSLALKDTLSNLFAGVQISVSGRIHLGDYIRLSTGEEGYVTDITWNNTQIMQWDNNMVIVPNAILTTALITNFHDREKLMLIWVDAGVGYRCDLRHVERVSLSVVKDVIMGLQKDYLVDDVTREFRRRLKESEARFKESKIHVQELRNYEEYVAGSIITRLKAGAAFDDMAIAVIHALDRSTVIEGVNPDVMLKLSQHNFFKETKERVINRIERGAIGCEPFVRYSAFDEYRITFGVYFYIQEFMNQYRLKHEIIKLLHERYQQEGIDIPLPVRTLYIPEQVQVQGVDEPQRMTEPISERGSEQP